MSSTRYIKSFSGGQVTIPKKVRDNLGLGKSFWLKLSIDNGKIIAEPMHEQKNKASYKQSLLDIKTVVDIEPQIIKDRKDMEQQVAKRAL